MLHLALHDPLTLSLVSNLLSFLRPPRKRSFSYTSEHNRLAMPVNKTLTNLSSYRQGMLTTCEERKKRKTTLLVDPKLLGYSGTSGGVAGTRAVEYPYGMLGRAHNSLSRPFTRTRYGWTDVLGTRYPVLNSCATKRDTFSQALAGPEPNIHKNKTPR